MKKGFILLDGLVSLLTVIWITVLVCGLVRIQIGSRPALEQSRLESEQAYAGLLQECAPCEVLQTPDAESGEPVLSSPSASW